MDSNKNIYETRSLTLSSTLICLGFKLDAALKDNFGRTKFIFRNTPELEEILTLFWKKDLKVEPNSLFEAQKFLKSKIYGE